MRADSAPASAVCVSDGNASPTKPVGAAEPNISGAGGKGTVDTTDSKTGASRTTDPGRDTAELERRLSALGKGLEAPVKGAPKSAGGRPSPEGLNAVSKLLDQASQFVGALSMPQTGLVDPPSRAGVERFKPKQDVPWYKMLFQCFITSKPQTREYTKLGDIIIPQMEEVKGKDGETVVRPVDVRATDGLSHTMVRGDVRWVRYKVKVYDQFDLPMNIRERDPVTWKPKPHSPTIRIISFPSVILDDVMQRFQTLAVDVKAVDVYVDQLRRTLNVDFRGVEAHQWRQDLLMFYSDYMTFLAQRRTVYGLLNFH